ncbi:MAG: nucleotidyltransferase family protein [Armatimonadota bacterium]|nr:nucleotidyltransferase family protein [Armatimonadota bacterium]
MDAVILAGGRCSPDLRKATGCTLRAELPFAGEPMAAKVAKTVKEAIEPLNTIVVGYELKGFPYAKAGATFVDSLRNGLDQVYSENFLLVAADLPFLEADSVREIVVSANLEMALNYPIVRSEACAERFPAMKRTTLRIREGKFTGGNIAVANKKWLQTIFPVLDEAYANRKKPLALASQIGIGTVIKVLWGRLFPSSLSLSTLEDAASKFLRAPVRAIATNRADIGADVDSLEQYQIALELAG